MLARGDGGQVHTLVVSARLTTDEQTFQLTLVQHDFHGVPELMEVTATAVVVLTAEVVDDAGQGALPWLGPEFPNVSPALK